VEGKARRRIEQPVARRRRIVTAAAAEPNSLVGTVFICAASHRSACEENCLYRRRWQRRGRVNSADGDENVPHTAHSLYVHWRRPALTLLHLTSILSRFPRLTAESRAFASRCSAWVTDALRHSGASAAISMEICSSNRSAALIYIVLRRSTSLTDSYLRVQQLEGIRGWSVCSLRGLFRPTYDCL